MAAARKLTPIFILAGLGTGLLCALSELYLESTGTNFILAAAAGTVITSCGIQSDGLSRRVPMFFMLCSVLIAGVIVSLSTQDANVLATGLCWTVLIATASFAIPLTLRGLQLEEIHGAAAAPEAGATVAQISGLSELKLMNATAADPLLSSSSEPHDFREKVPELVIVADLESPIRPLSLFDSKLGAEAELEQFEEDFEGELEEGFTLGDEQVLQSWSRVKSLTEERLDGTFLIEFTSGLKQRYVHFPFVPMLRGALNAYCECDGGGDFDAEIDQLHAYGVRVSIRRRGDVSGVAQVELSLVVSVQQSIHNAA